MVQRTEVPDADLHAGGLSSVEAACEAFLRKRGLIRKLTSRYKRGAGEEGFLAAKARNSNRLS